MSFTRGGAAASKQRAVPPLGGQDSQAASSSATTFVSFSTLSALQVSAGLIELVPQFKPYSSAWSKSILDGKFILSSTPSRFRAELKKAMPSMTDRYTASAFECMREKVLAEFEHDNSSVDADTHQLWRATVQSVPPLPPPSIHEGGGQVNAVGPGSTSHEGGAANLPPPPSGQFVSHIQQGGLQNLWSPPSAPTVNSNKFAFGRREQMSPLPLMNHLNTPSQFLSVMPTTLFQDQGATTPLNPTGMPTSCQLGAPTSHQVSAAAPTSMHQYAAPTSQLQSAAPTSQHQSAVPTSQPQSAVPTSQPQQAVPTSQFLSAASTNQPQQAVPTSQMYPALSNAINLQQLPQILQNSQFAPSTVAGFHHQISQQQQQQFNLHQLHFDHGKKPLMPWEIEALQRPPKPQDEGMMPGFSRLSIAAIIDNAKQQRLQLSSSVSTPQIYEQVVFPEMSAFTEEEFLRVRKEFYAATRKSINSCLFKDFKTCMTDRCRMSAYRKFSLDDNSWIHCPDIKIQHWFSMFFGPKSKAEALARLENVKFASHNDAQDDQSSFVNKLEDCATEFELAINDIADTHTTWVSDSTKLDSGELSIKEVMDVWRRKFPKQERTVFSVQLKECREFMDRNKSSLFSNIIMILSNHFADQDALVKSGRVHYSTTPSQPRRLQGQRQPPPAKALGSDQQSSLGKRERETPRLSFKDSSRQPISARPNSKPKSGLSDKPKRITPGHLRGISCGSVHNHFGLGCSANTCPFFGTAHDKNKGGHSWKDSDKEDSVRVDTPTYEALCKAKPGMLDKWAKAKDQQAKARLQARISAISEGQQDPEEESDDSDDLRAALDEFNQGEETAHSDTSSVNDDECFVSAIAASSCIDADPSPADLLSLHKMKQFFGVSRVVGPMGSETSIKTLLDPGAEYNIISPEIRDLCCIKSLPVQVAFFQGKKKQCVVEEIAQCRFELQNISGDFVKHIEWCTVADLGYELLLGRKFCHDNGFTTFDALLREWGSNLTTPVAVSSLSAVSDGAGKSPPQRVPSGVVNVRVSRVDAPEGDAKYKRPPKCLRCPVPLAPQNSISEKDLTSSNSLSNLKVLKSRRVNGVVEVELEFSIESDKHDVANTKYVEWFTVDSSTPKGYVNLASQGPPANAIFSAGRIKPLQPAQTVAVLKSSTPEAVSGHAATDESISKRPRQHSGHVNSSSTSIVSPLLTATNQSLARFTRSNIRSRTAVPVHVDNCAACNVIDRQLLTCEHADSAIKIFKRKSANDILMVLLEFSMECKDKSEAKFRFREWFRVEDNARRQIIIRGMFDAERISAQTTEIAVSSIQVQSADSSASNVPLDSAASISHAKSRFALAKFDQLESNRFVSFHPVSKYRLKRPAEPPIHPFNYHRDHASAKINDYRYLEHSAIKSGMIQADLASQVAKSLQTLNQTVNRLPDNVRATERAAIAAMSARPTFVNAELAFDELAKATSNAKLAELLLPDGDVPPLVSDPWQGNPVFKSGCYAEIHGAMVTTDLNGKRVRLYDKSEIQNVWLVRVLGKNSGIWKCNEKFLRELPHTEQARMRPAGNDIGFLDVAIDETGQPTGELPSLAHRQFGSEYSKQLSDKIADLKSRYPHVFSKDVSEPCGFEKMEIKLVPNAILPSKSRFYRNTPKMKEEVKRQIQEQLDWGAIRKAETAHCSDILLVKRPHMPGQWRFVINFQKLNDATVPEQLIMPDPASQHARLAGCKIFGALDLSSYFRQLQLSENSQYLTGFASDEGTYVHTRVPMGIRNAPSFSQRVLQEALAKDPVLGPLGIKNYFDDVPFGAASEDEFLYVMEAMLKFCEQWKLKVNPDKSVFGVTSITHVGFVVSENGISIDPERTRDIAEMQAPKSLKKVQSVLGVLNYVRHFIPNFSAKAKHLTDKLSAAPTAPHFNSTAKPAAAPFIWSVEDQRQFEELKKLVLAAPMLSQLDYSKQIHVRCDASRFGAGAVLFQYDDQGRELVACYASRKFLPAETRWSTFQQEASTVVWALERFLEYTQGYHVVVECDHRNISFVKRSSMPQLARWRMRLQDHDFSIQFLSGQLNCVADGLSRSHVDDVEVTLADAMPECSLLYAKPSAVSDYAAVAAIEIAPYRLRSGKPMPISKPEDEDDQLASASDSNSSDDSDDSGSDDDTIETVPRFGTDGEVINANGHEPSAQEIQPGHVTAPFVDVDSEMSAVHNDLVGHKGVYTSLQRLLRNGRSWGSRKQMIDDVDAFIQGCPVCQKMKKRRNRATVDRHTIAGSPFAELSIDVLKLPKVDARGNKYCVVIVDSFSRWTSLTACANKSALDAARALLQFIGNFGAPLRLRSDGGGEFVNGIIVSLTRMMGVTPLVVQAYTPTANGIVERANRAILEQVREMCMCQRLVQHTHHQWGDLLPLVQRTMNASIHMPIGTSPSRILFGDCLDLDRALLTRIPAGRVLDVSTYCDALAHNQRVIIEEADRIQSAVCDKVIAKAMAKQQNLPARSFAVNDWVLVKPQPQFPLHKLAPRWLGPFRIHSISASSEKVLVLDTVADKLVKVLKRQLEHFNTSQVTSVAGLTKVAESDAFEFPVESIMGHALITDQGVGVEPVQLHRSFVRGVRSKNSFQFLIKWTGYEQPTWIAFKDAKHLVQFPGYVSVFEGLNML